MSSRDRQYWRNDSEVQRPVALTTSGGVPASSNSVIFSTDAETVAGSARVSQGAPNGVATLEEKGLG